jgi:hypothetical protein
MAGGVSSAVEIFFAFRMECFEELDHALVAYTVRSFEINELYGFSYGSGNFSSPLVARAATFGDANGFPEIALIQVGL